MGERLLEDLATVGNQVSKEVSLLRTFPPSRKARQHRLLQLFQCDLLLPGWKGKVLNLKIGRDNGLLHFNDGIALWAKVLGYSVVWGSNTCMLFYVFLFALRQTKIRQDAWFRSFLIWFGLDTILVCTIVVLISNIIIPSIIMKDLSKIKERLLAILQIHRLKMNQANSTLSNNETIERVEDASTREFNAADYFFVSVRISQMEEFKHLLVALVISTFRTPWPKQTYQQGHDETLMYRSPYWSVLFGIKNVLVFLIGGFIKTPPSFQDGIVYMVFSAVCGYIIVLLTQLYIVHPSLIAIPVVMALLLTHYIIRFLTTIVKGNTTSNIAQVTLDPTSSSSLSKGSASTGRMPTMTAAIQVRTYSRLKKTFRVALLLLFLLLATAYLG